MIQPEPTRPERMSQDDDPAPVLALIRTAFAGMEGRINPPSSVHRLTAADLAHLAQHQEIWLIRDQRRVLACMALTALPLALPDHLYLGKLAVAASHRGRGLARQLVEHACERAQARGLGAVELQVRVELVENHDAFRAMGFRQTAATAHPGFDRPTSLTFRRAVALA